MTEEPDPIATPEVREWGVGSREKRWWGGRINKLVCLYSSDYLPHSPLPTPYF